MKVSDARLVGVVTVFGLLLRLINLDRTAVVDEAITIGFAWDFGMVSLLTKLPLLQPHPPLYYVLVNAITSLGGGIVAVRLLSVAAGVATIPAIYYLGQRIFDSKTGLFAAAIVTISPFHVSLSQLARMYALVGLLTVVSWWLIIRAVESDFNRRVTAGYAVASAALALTHYFGVLTLVAQWVWVLGIKRDSVLTGRKLSSSVGLTGLALTPIPVWLGYHVFRKVAASSTTVVGLPHPSAVVIGRMSLSTLFGWSVARTISLHPELAAVVGAGTLLFALGAISSQEVRRPRIENPVTLWVFLPLAVVVAISLVKPVLRPRYVIGPVVGAYLGLAVLAKTSWESGERTAVAVLLLTMVAAAPAQATTDRNGGWADAKSALESQSEPGDKLVVAGTFGREKDYRIRNVDLEVVGEGPVQAKINARVGGDETVWVLRSWTQRWPWSERLEPSAIGLESHCITSSETFGRVKLFKLEPSAQCEAQSKLEAGR